MTVRDQEDEVAGSSPIEQRRILFLSLELNYSPFSGNGVLARSLVSSLTRRDDCAVRVICAKPHPSTEALSKDICMDHVSEGGDLEIWPAELPEGCQWRRLDRSGAWEEYSELSVDYAAHVREFEPTDIVAVDWHGMLAWKKIHENLKRNELLYFEKVEGGETSWTSSNVNVCYYNFRVFSSSSWEHDLSVDEEVESDDQFYRMQEQQSCRLACVIVGLAENDRSMLYKLIDDDSSNESESETMKRIHILHPPLRGDIWELAKYESVDCNDRCLPPDASFAIEKVASLSSRKRMFITCMARFSPEKSAHNFVTLLQKLGGVEFLRKNSLIPIMCGARAVEGYAQKVVDDLHFLCSLSAEGEPWPYVVIDHNLGPQELAAVYSYTVLNVYPCLYCPYGMTVVESAAFGVPSVVNKGKIGASSLLGEGKGCIAVDLEQILDQSCNSEMQIKTIREALQSANSTSLGQLAAVARTRALDWDERACCEGLIDIMRRNSMV
mmetsp:Transcript_34808/g.74126  ORF Transcript_34808/g.74126 Transcript_34808/m.74126 type:complete len:496 (-) Transcript_34808:62-1549(-)